MSFSVHFAILCSQETSTQKKTYLSPITYVLKGEYQSGAIYILDHFQFLQNKKEVQQEVSHNSK